MKCLALIRHGDISGGDLSPAGERQATRLGQQLRDLEQTSRRILSSPAPRARQTASIISSFLDVLAVEEDGRLWSGPDGDPDSWEHDPAGLARQLDDWGTGVELLVVVTHCEICSGLPPLLAVRHGLTGRLPTGLPRGQGLLVDLESRSWRLLVG